MFIDITLFCIIEDYVYNVPIREKEIIIIIHVYYVSVLLSIHTYIYVPYYISHCIIILDIIK